MHNWEFLPKKGKYRNGVIKKQVAYVETEKSLEIQNEKNFPDITKINPNKKTKVQIRFFNHAFLMISTDGFKFATDPWAVGPAFNNGWWLQKKTKSDWLKEINKVDFIYLSHNHPDHLHEETLSLINKDIPIIVPNFRNDSVGKYIETLGFKKIIRLEFLKDSHRLGSLKIKKRIQKAKNKSSKRDIDQNKLKKFTKILKYDLQFNQNGAKHAPLSFASKILGDPKGCSRASNI